MARETLYDVADEFGLLYDEVPAYAARTDVAFYQSLAAEAGAGAAVLDVGCGTGRLLLPLARAGHAVVGVDASAAMLERCRAKLAAEPAEVRARVSLHQADARDFTVAVPEGAAGFALAIAPFRILQHLVTPAEQLRCVGAVARHLAPGGRFAFDVFNPNVPVMTRDRSAESEDTPERALPDGRTMRRTVRVARVHWVEQVSDIELYYYLRAADGAERRVVQAFPMRWFWATELEHLLARAGLRVRAAYGNFDRSPLGDESPEIVVVAEHER
jgi:SAM-dependent methyltransferase